MKMISSPSLRRNKPFLSFWSQTAIWIILGFLAGSLLGCKYRESEQTDTLYVALSAAPSTLDPRFTTDATGQRVVGLLFESIVRMGPDLQIMGEAATHWTYKNLVYTFELRPGLTFSDGQPVTKDDLEFTFAQYRDPKSPFSSAMKVIDQVSAEYNDSQRVLRIKLTKFSASFLTDLSPIKLIPKKRVEAEGDDFGRHPVGSGPYAFVSQNANEIRLKARTKDVLVPPATPYLTFKIIRDDSTRYYKVLKGEVDIAQAELAPTKVPTFEGNPKFNVFKGPGLAMTHLLVNLRDPTLQNQSVRQAIAMAINRDEIIRYKMEGLGIPATSILPPGSPFFANDLQNLPYDIERAKQLIEKSGLKGQELVLKTSNTPSVVENARVIAHQLETIGFSVKLQSFEWGTFYDDIKKGNFQLASMKWVGATDPDVYRVAFHSAELPPGRNRGAYINHKLDRLVEEGLKIENFEQRRKTYFEVQRMIQEDLPMIPLWYDTQVAVVNARIKGFTLSQNGDYSAFARVKKESK